MIYFADEDDDGESDDDSDSDILFETTKRSKNKKSLSSSSNSKLNGFKNISSSIPHHHQNGKGPLRNGILKNPRRIKT